MASRMTLEFELKKQSIFRKDIFKPTEDSMNYLYAHFTFDEDWKILDKKVAIFTYQNKDYMVDIDNETDSCEIIEDVIKASGFKIGVKGYLNNKQVIITSDPLFVAVKKTLGIEDGALEPIRQLLSSTLDVKKFQYTGSIEIPNIYATKIGYNEDKTKLTLYGRLKDSGEELILNEVELLDSFGLDKVESGYYDNENKKMVFILNEEILQLNDGFTETFPSEENPKNNIIEIPFEFNIDNSNFEIDLTNYYNKEEVDNKLLEKVNNRDFQSYKDTTRNTLNNLVSIDSFDSYKDQNSIDLNNKVDKEDGKVLSSYDYTNEDKLKVDKLIFDADGKISSEILPQVEIDGINGLDGKDGVGISSVEIVNYEQDTENNSTITNIQFTLTDGNKTNQISIKARNGENGKDGADGQVIESQPQQLNNLNEEEYYNKSEIDTKITNINSEISTINQDIENITMALSQLNEQSNAGGVSSASLFSEDEPISENSNNNAIDYSNEIQLLNEKLDNIQSQVDAISNNNSNSSNISTKSNELEKLNISPIVDIVANFQKLSDYNNKNNLNVGDIVQVLIDEKYNNASTIYKWNGTYFSYVGKFGSSYSKNELDVMLKSKEIHTHYINIYLLNQDEIGDDFELQLSFDIVSNRKDYYKKDELFTYLQNASENTIKANGFYRDDKNSLSIILFICEVNTTDGTMIIETANQFNTNTLTFDLNELGVYDKVV